MPGVRFERVAKAYGHRQVLQDFTLSIQDGEFFTLLGPSGCGKSTVLSLVAGLEPVSSGEIYFDSRAITHLSPKARDVAMVFQSYALYPHKTVVENLAFPLRLRKLPDAELKRKVEWVSQMLAIGGILHKRPAEISGGERQRVALGRAMIREPAVFLMDEPLSNLDVQLRLQTRAEIKALHTRLKTTTVYVTHDQEEALVLSDRIAVLNRGVIQQIGNPEEIYFHPANLFVAEFIGTPRINLIPGRILAGSPPILDLGTIRIPVPQGPKISDGVGIEVLVGLRPEDLRIVPRAGNSENTVEVLSVELTGARAWGDVRWGPHTVRAAAAEDYPLRVGERAALELRPEKLHFFNPASGRRLD
jgi:multiple sugar transport system ATP-binding protein